MSTLKVQVIQFHRSHLISVTGPRYQSIVRRYRDAGSSGMCGCGWLHRLHIANTLLVHHSHLH